MAYENTLLGIVRCSEKLAKVHLLIEGPFLILQRLVKLLLLFVIIWEKRC
jgi:hypothetical protein